jgi:4-hydroxy-tetrahydrodipicolinate synthase
MKLVGRLMDAFPDRIVGLKDSSGDWEHTKELIEAYPDLNVFPGSEVFLLDGLRAGGVGCITATGNINPTGIRAVYTGRDGDNADALQKKATEIRLAVQNAGIPITVMKAYLALKTGDDD